MDDDETERLITRARAIDARYKDAKSHYDDLSHQRVEVINQLRDNGVAWSKIGNVLGVSPQAAMYASGQVKRKRKK